MVNTAIKITAKAPANMQVPMTYPYVLEPSLIAWDALEPHIDAATMRIHHEKHHQAYITQLNAVLKDYPELHGFSIEELLRRLDEVPGAIRQAVRNYGGGHANHQLFWKILKPAIAMSKPSGSLQKAIDRDFGSFEEFKDKFVETGEKHFGSGWVFLAINMEGKLEVLSRPNQDSVLSERKSALLINDLWEHAYYLKYRNIRLDYLKAFWNVVNWEYVGRCFEEQMRALAGHPVNG